MTYEFAGVQSCDGLCVFNLGTSRYYKMSLSGDPNLTITALLPVGSPNIVDTGLTLTVTRYSDACLTQEWQETMPLLFYAYCHGGELSVNLYAQNPAIDPLWPDDPSYDSQWFVFWSPVSNPGADPVAGTLPNIPTDAGYCLASQDPTYAGFGGLVRVSY